ncbi:Hypoxia induced protein conserved region [Cohaesibacter marisflavi]|uniref:Hypoxia induced protein conserved region n=1 Tax=Cohaesibacter marisflavi TaxID=655353 RepID=A0A1I5IKM5_9HYPH|nr:twin transmembrane helix small protein [Cohaesibacter marisflavi]SFO61188.1 Hypoxia induced protein conserved region [Cohaesibacter marisflavi]
MSSILSALIPVSLLAVALILVVGLVNMMRGSNPNRSQRLMRWRVLLQLLAIVIVMASLYFLQ